ncbi:hypothetical protein MIND_00088900 [Mycena indigotica]|uniref:DEAD/DEAH-box helicase domain-containing protein n=1 Tax=Mycena indigotica TaxID=2126181 RepID=A0A8H6THA0_9AGAR|nr:uncharacterized protein MIND_00088900 [Mycena indigotica]KAF7315730.1 hypothetical protein MIND_00088900 [Mycena indigotica]
MKFTYPLPKRKPFQTWISYPLRACLLGQPTFTVPRLHPVQSKLYPIAFGTDEPILLCAQAGAGKTNVAILNELGKHRDEETGKFDLDAFKIVYIAPMKALTIASAMSAINTCPTICPKRSKTR